MKNMGLTSSNHNPCLFFGIIDDGTPPKILRHNIHVGIYIDGFFSSRKLDAEESRFKKPLNKKFATDFMGDADFFPGSSFKCNRRPEGNLSVHVPKKQFTEHTTSRFSLKDCNCVALTTPYCSGCPIYSIPDPNPDDPDPPRHKDVYQSICGLINWLSILTRPDTATVLSFLNP